MSVQTDCGEYMVEFQHHLITLEDLHSRYLSYQTAFNKLLIEIARRRQYQEAAEHIVKTMMSQLQAMTEGDLEFLLR
jgi:autophagy-related protein 17